MFTTPQECAAALQEAGLGHLVSHLLPLLREGIQIFPAQASASSLLPSSSRIGGQPHLPGNVLWPTNELGAPLSFIAQINLEEIANYHSGNLLPSKGVLYFFYDAEQAAWGLDPADIQAFQIIFSETVPAHKLPDPFPEGLDPQARFAACQLTFAPRYSLPDWEHDALDGLLTDKEAGNYLSLIAGEEENTKLLGHANCIQGAMEAICQLAANGLNCSDGTAFTHPSAESLLEASDQWQLLLQVDSIQAANMQWGDVGRLYFWIRQEDLKHRNFHKAWIAMQCC